MHFEWAGCMGMPISADKGQKIVSSVRMGFDEDPKEFLQESMIDLARVENISIWYKHVQVWGTRKDLMLLYSPTRKHNVVK